VFLSNLEQIANALDSSMARLQLGQGVSLMDPGAFPDQLSGLSDLVAECRILLEHEFGFDEKQYQTVIRKVDDLVELLKKERQLQVEVTDSAEET